MSKYEIKEVFYVSFTGNIPLFKMTGKCACVHSRVMNRILPT